MNVLGNVSTVWGVRLCKRFCRMFSESSTGCWAVLQVPCCLGELTENILQHLFNKLPPQTEEMQVRTPGRGRQAQCARKKRRGFLPFVQESAGLINALTPPPRWDADPIVVDARWLFKGGSILSFHSRFTADFHCFIPLWNSPITPELSWVACIPSLPFLAVWNWPIKSRSARATWESSNHCDF